MERSTIAVIKTVIGLLEALIDEEPEVSNMEANYIENVDFENVKVGKIIRFDNIRLLLVAGFTEDELRHFCYDHPKFSEVSSSLANLGARSDIADKIIHHANQKLKMGTLLGWAKHNNPKQYQKYQPYS